VPDRVAIRAVAEDWALWRDGGVEAVHILGGMSVDVTGDRTAVQARMTIGRRGVLAFSRRCMQRPLLRPVRAARPGMTVTLDLPRRCGAAVEALNARGADRLAIR
jgi:hypothetical protein